jgi:glycosyltransferase involved in cell wall biosynthesis
MKNWIVVPLYNEEQRFELSYWNAITSRSNFIFLFVNDGSTDNTLHVLGELRNTNIRILNLEKNVGKSEAIRAGLNHAMNQCGSMLSLVGYLDSDTAFSKLEVIEILDGSEKVFSDLGLDALWMSRVKLAGRKIERGFLRHYIGRLIASYLGRGVPEFPYDTQCGFKLFKSTPILLEALATKFQTRWFVDLEILCRIFKIKTDPISLREWPLENWREVEGSKIQLRNFLSIFLEIMTIRKALVAQTKGSASGSARA